MIISARKLPQEPETEVSEATLARYLALKDYQKAISTELEQIKKLCKKRGSFCTDHYVCAVYEQDQKRLAGLEEMLDAGLGETLDELDLIRVITFDVVKITKR